ncbi:glycoside hydrolase domain-containing protein [Luteibacter yeojuensis]|uniref:Rv2525c-like glycoside hydrolase-like domain-containing protein n=1 Tax=Luteibacter yeojuensis TaxID=345309 RepID=A0A0F3K9G0_9GAMM|nr:glycoside hydrolase domain-containing protein [Luteibacter yeojuensis]KJV27602.1 hypothetical protein VI08_17800 [Luteibacter yeojuensis]
MPRNSVSVRTAAAGLQGFDADTPITAATAKAFAASGFRFCVRYLSRTRPSKGDLSSAELQGLLAAGLGVMAVQHVDTQGWSPSAELGMANGQAAAANATAAGLPIGVTVWLDLEGVAARTAKQDVIDYANAWFAELAAAGYEPGVYVGASCGLTGDDLYWRLQTKHYWRGGSKVPDLPHRGYQLVQRITTKADIVNGIAIDRDVTYVDAFGDAPTWAAL